MKKIISILISAAVLFALGGCNASTIEDVSSEASDQVASATSSELVSREEVSGEVSSEETITSVPTSSKETPSSKPVSSKISSSSKAPEKEPVSSNQRELSDAFVSILVTDTQGNVVKGFECAFQRDVPTTQAEDGLIWDYPHVSDQNGRISFSIYKKDLDVRSTGLWLSHTKNFMAKITYPNGNVYELDAVAFEQDGKIVSYYASTVGIDDYIVPKENEPTYYEIVLTFI